MKRFKGEFFLLLAALIWGSSFIFQKVGMNHVGPLTFCFFRFTIGALVLLPVIWIFDRFRKKSAFCQRKSDKADVYSEGNKTLDVNMSYEEYTHVTISYNFTFKSRELYIGGLLTGFVCFAASALQQIGIVYTDAGKAGFITSLYIVLVPIILIFFKQKTGMFTWIGVIIGSLGLYLLCITDGFSIALGDGLVMACAVFYALQIIFIDMYADKVDPIKLAFVEFLVTGVMSGIGMLIFETVEIQGILDCTIPILYTAILEVSVAFTLEIFGQRETPPAIAGILMSLESVFAVICGMIFLKEVMTSREIAGCIVMLMAVIISQLPQKSMADSK